MQADFCRPSKSQLTYRLLNADILLVLIKMSQYLIHYKRLLYVLNEYFIFFRIILLFSCFVICYGSESNMTVLKNSLQ